MESEDFYDHGEFRDRIEQEMGGDPDRRKFEEFSGCLRQGSILEIGPGTGHYLAAAREAGFSVAGIELSAFHRDYIREKWGIVTESRPLEDNRLPEGSFDNIVSFNCLEHVPDPAAHIAAALRVLKPGGRFVVSTCNAACLSRRLTGRYWSMFKPPDHFSIPTPKGLRLGGARAGFLVLRMWTSEYPLATPISVMVALRDWLRERRHSGESEPASSEGRTGQSTGRSLILRVNRAETWLGWTSALVARFGLADSVKALYEKP